MGGVDQYGLDKIKQYPGTSILSSQWIFVEVVIGEYGVQASIGKNKVSKS